MAERGDAHERGGGELVSRRKRWYWALVIDAWRGGIHRSRPMQRLLVVLSGVAAHEEPSGGWGREWEHILRFGDWKAFELSLPDPWDQSARKARTTSSILFSWNRRMAAMRRLRLAGGSAFSSVMPPRAKTGILVWQACCKAARPWVALRERCFFRIPDEDTDRRLRLSTVTSSWCDRTPRCLASRGRGPRT